MCQYKIYENPFYSFRVVTCVKTEGQTGRTVIGVL